MKRYSNVNQIYFSKKDFKEKDTDYATILEDDSLEDMYRVIVPYNPNFLNDFKIVIPIPYRRWNPTSKCWYVSKICIADLIPLLKKYFKNIKTNIGAESSSENPYTIMGLTSKASNEVIKAAYKALALKLHPDRGGDSNKMEELNLAYEKIKKERSIS